MVNVSEKEAIGILQNDERKLQAIDQQMRSLVTMLNEVRSAKNTLENIPKEGTSSMIPIGAGLFLPGTISNGNVSMNIGAGVITEKPVEDAIKFLKEREEEINKDLNELQKNAGEIQQQMMGLKGKLQTKQQENNTPVIG